MEDGQRKFVLVTADNMGPVTVWLRCCVGDAIVHG